MNARVFLLALVTAVFMAIWDADRPVTARTRVAQSEMQETAATDPGFKVGIHEALIPLPTNLQPGTWQVISRDGDTFRITIERRDSLSGSTPTEALASENSEKRFCVITAPDGIRWCFIKEHPKTAAKPGAIQ
jgi:hypothetical protein